MIVAFLPPISAMHGRGERPCASVRYKCVPMSKLPVNVAPATSACEINAWPRLVPGPVTYLNTPGGMPASRSANASNRPLHGVDDAGLETTVSAAPSAAPPG